MLMSVPLSDELYSKKRKAHVIASSSVHRMLMRVPLSDNLLLKNCKAHFTTLSRVRRVLISAPLSGDLLSKYNIRVLMSAPVYGKIVQIYRPNRVIYIKRITYEKVNGSIVNVGVIPSKVVITKPRLEKDHKSLLDHKAKGHVVAEKNDVF